MAVLALIVPVSINAYSASQKLIEGKKAVAFLEEFKTESEKIALLGEKSKTTIEAIPSKEWKITAKDGKVVVEFEGKELERNIGIEVKEFEKTFSKQFLLTLEKNKGILVIKDS